MRDSEGLGQPSPVHVITITTKRGSVELEELTRDGSKCRASTSRGHFVGTTATVLAAACELPVEDDWVQAIAAALDRERGWEAWGSVHGRAHGLEMKKGDGMMYHVTAIENRSSVERWGLDWDRMRSSPGVAGSLKPEAPGIWLTEHAEDDFFVEMARHAVEMWEVDVTDLWLERRPQDWWFTSERIAPNRLRLLPPLHTATGE
jgi:hypothetical protein